MEKDKLIQVLYFWTDLYNFVIGLGLVAQSVQENARRRKWMLMASGLAFSVISLVPTLYRLIRRSDEKYQVSWQYKKYRLLIICFNRNFGPARL